uniref:Esterase/lipase n=1 Tax=uncultured bacterium Contigcl_1539 TaxID=1393650 RepID=W0FLX9_9BACT|nr:esterase/lipase [uncultured bacterium Contigcl_1539]
MKIIPLPPDSPPFLQPDVDVSDIKRKYLDVPYAGTENPNQMMDIFLPEEGDGPFPALIQFHGGAFVGGHKRDSQCVYLFNGLLRGYAVINVNYRLIDEVIFPYPVYDTKAAIRFLRANAEKYCLDPTRFAVSGDSAGAYFAAMLGTSAGVEALEDRSMGAPDEDSSVQAVIGMFGLYDLILASQFTEDAPPMPSGVKIPNFADLFAGVNCREAKGIASFASPVSYVSKNCPPVLIQAGMEDEVVPYKSSVEFVERINAVCGEGRAVLQSIPGGKHGDPAYESEEYEESRFDFLDRVFQI